MFSAMKIVVFALCLALYMVSGKLLVILVINNSIDCLKTLPLKWPYPGVFSLFFLINIA